MKKENKDKVQINRNIIIYTKNNDIANEIKEICDNEKIKYNEKLIISNSYTNKTKTGLHIITPETLKTLIEIIIPHVTPLFSQAILNKIKNKFKKEEFKIEENNDTIVIIIFD